MTALLSNSIDHRIPYYKFIVLRIARIGNATWAIIPQNEQF